MDLLRAVIRRMSFASAVMLILTRTKLALLHFCWSGDPYACRTLSACHGASPYGQMHYGGQQPADGTGSYGYLEDTATNERVAAFDPFPVPS